MRLARCLALAALLPACTSETSFTTDEAEIVGGINAPAGKWPDVAAVNIGGGQACTGTLIAPTVVLTAGHCNDAGLDSVLLGTTSLNRASEGEIIPVSKRVEYPSWESSADLTVLVLARPSRFQPRAVATGWAGFDIKNGAPINIVGYGAIDRDGEVYVPDLKEATTTITDADCTVKPGCVDSVKPAGELGAGGMGIDTCFGDSGGPLYLPTAYGAFLAGVTSRGYPVPGPPCSEGGLYVRPDKFINWIEQAAGVPVTRGPSPTAELITTVRGVGGETTIAHNDPKTESHTFTIKTPPMYGTAAVREDGKVRVCPNENIEMGGDSLVVSVTDKADPTRTLDVKVNVLIQAGDGGTKCDPMAFGADDDDGGGCCQSGRSAGGAAPLALGILAVLVRRRRRR